MIYDYNATFSSLMLDALVDTFRSYTVCKFECLFQTNFKISKKKNNGKSETVVWQAILLPYEVQLY